MRLPIFEKIELADYTTGALKAAFARLNIGKSPYYIEINKKDSKLVNEALANILQVINEMEIQINFPFPFYVIAKGVDHFGELNIVSSEEELPRYFFKKEKKLKNKEKSLLNKTHMLTEKISNLNLPEAIDHLKNDKDRARRLSEVTRECLFLEHVIQKLMKVK